MKPALQPQEVEVFYVIPAVRSSLARYLKESGRSQKEIAALLGMRESTVSHYIHEKRAAKIHFDENIEKKIKEASERIKDNIDVIREVQYLLHVIRKTKSICQIHFEVNKEIPKGCDACFEAERLMVR